MITYILAAFLWIFIGLIITMITIRNMGKLDNSMYYILSTIFWPVLLLFTALFFLIDIDINKSTKSFYEIFTKDEE